MKRNLSKPILAFAVMGLFAGDLHAAMIVKKDSSPTEVTKPVENNATVVPADVTKNAVAEFKNLSHRERKERLNEVKLKLKEYKEQQLKGSASDNTILEVILAILIPPLAVYLHEGKVDTKFWISLLLTLLFWIPGVIYALIVVLGKG